MIGSLLNIPLPQHIHEFVPLRAGMSHWLRTTQKCKAYSYRSKKSEAFRYRDVDGGTSRIVQGDNGELVYEGRAAVDLRRYLAHQMGYLPTGKIESVVGLPLRARNGAVARYRVRDPRVDPLPPLLEVRVHEDRGPKLIGPKSLLPREVEKAKKPAPRVNPGATQHKKKTPKKPSSRKAKVEALLSRDGPDCWYCGKDLGGDITIEHIRAKANGGTNALENLALAHKRCNATAGNLPVPVKHAYRDHLRAKG